MSVRPLDGHGEAVLPARYVAEHVELRYGTTVFSAPGRTVGTAHAVVGAAMTREALYVAATRGRESNRLYVDVEPETPGAEASHGRPESFSARQVLISVAHHTGAEASAHRVMAGEWASAESLGRLVAAHESLVAVASSGRWEAELARAGFPPEAIVAARSSAAWDRLARSLDAAEDRGLPVSPGPRRLATAGLVPSVPDPAASPADADLALGARG
jgi:hypothetical protein